MLAHDVGWSVLDIAFSPDGEHFAYSSWADSCKWHCASNCALVDLVLYNIFFQYLLQYINVIYLEIR